MKRLLLLLLPLLAWARPTPEIIAYPDLIHTLKDWQKTTQPKPFKAKGDEFSGLSTGDIFLWETYRGQPLVKGDAIVFQYKGQRTAREIGAITSTGVRTVRGTDLPFAAIEGVVRRVLRITAPFPPQP